MVFVLDNCSRGTYSIKPEVGTENGRLVASGSSCEWSGNAFH